MIATHRGEERPDAVAVELGRCATMAQIQLQRLRSDMPAGEWHQVRGSAERLLKRAQAILDRLDQFADD